MVDPREHANTRGWIESILRYIPGFRGYLEADYRRESDRLTRTHLWNRLNLVKQQIDAYQEQLVNSGNLDDLTQCERVVQALFTLGNRIQGDVQGYSGFFDYVQIGTDELDRVVEIDLSLVNQAESLVQSSQALLGSLEPAATLAAKLKQQVDSLAIQFQERSNLLQGLESKGK